MTGRRSSLDLPTSYYTEAEDFFTFECWFNMTHKLANENRTLFSIGNTDADTFQYLSFSPEKGDKPAIDIGNKPLDQPVKLKKVTFQETIARNNLTHVVIEINKESNTVRSFINGVQTSQNTANFSLVDLTVDHFYVGKSHNPEAGNFIGIIRDIKIYHSRLDKNKVKALFEKGL